MTYIAYLTMHTHMTYAIVSKQHASTYTNTMHLWLLRLLLDNPLKFIIYVMVADHFHMIEREYLFTRGYGTTYFEHQHQRH